MIRKWIIFNRTPAQHLQKCIKSAITKARIATMVDLAKCTTYDLKVDYFESNSCSEPFKAHKMNS